LDLLKGSCLHLAAPKSQNKYCGGAYWYVSQPINNDLAACPILPERYNKKIHATLLPAIHMEKEDYILMPFHPCSRFMEGKYDKEVIGRKKIQDNEVFILAISDIMEIEERIGQFKNMQWLSCKRICT